MKVCDVIVGSIVELLLTIQIGLIIQVCEDLKNVIQRYLETTPCTILDICGQGALWQRLPGDYRYSIWKWSLLPIYNPGFLPVISAPNTHGP